MFEKSYKKGLTAPKKDTEGLQVRDMFQTPAYATDLLIPFIPKDIVNVWEPACGSGKISRQLRKAGYTVYETDIKHTNPENAINFLDGGTRNVPGKFSIITNPPFSIKERFVERCFEYQVPFALLINADYSQQLINWMNRGCEKIVPTARISYLTPNIVRRVNDKLGTSYETIDDIPMHTIYKFSSAQFHSLWLTWRFGLGRTETFIPLSVEDRKNNI